MKKFEHNEIEMIKESFKIRKRRSDITHKSELDNITSILSFPIKRLNSFQKAIIIGCIKEFAIYPNECILQKSEYEVLLLRKEIEQDCLKIDVASRILNKIKKKDEPKRWLFEQTFEKIDKLTNSKLIYYSITKEGEIYKAGIVTGKNNGMKIEFCPTSIISNFKIGFLNQGTFMSSGNPTELVKYIEYYGKENVLTENHKRFVKIIQNVIS